MATNKDLGIVHRLFISHTIGKVNQSSNPAAFKVLELVVPFPADDDHGVCFKKSITSIMKSVGATDGRWKVMLWTIEGERASFAIVVGKNGESTAVLGGKRVADGCDLRNELWPANLIGHIVVIFHLPVPSGRANGPHRQVCPCADGGVDNHRDNNDRPKASAKPRCTVRESTLQSHRSRGIEHRIGRHQVIATAFGYGKKHQRTDVESAEQAKLPAEQKRNEASNRKGKSQKREFDLVGIEHFSNTRAVLSGVQGGFFLRKKPLGILLSLYTNWKNALVPIGPPLAHIASVNELLHLQRDEVMTSKPEKIGRGDEGGREHLVPEEPATQMTALRWQNDDG